jgi:hypothetical protein
VVPTRLGFLLELKFSDLIGHQQRNHGIQTGLLPGLDLFVEPIATSRSREDAQAACPGSIDPIDLCSHLMPSSAGRRLGNFSVS